MTKVGPYDVLHLTEAKVVFGKILGGSVKPSQSKNFWKNFAKLHWEKKPLHAKEFQSSLSEIKEQQIFDMLVEYSDHCRKIKSADGFKLYIDGQRQHQEEILQILPVKKDRSFQAYNKRMEMIFEDYCLVCDELLQVSRSNQQKLQDFGDTLFSYVGFPNRFAEIGLYLGNYRKTPFGVHVDGCGVFSFPVVGKKTFRIWKPEYVKKNPRLDCADEYSKFKKDSLLLKAKVGDMTYWPSSAWHIAESDGSFSVTWSLGVWVDRTHQQNLEAALSPLLKSALGAEGVQMMNYNLKPQRNDEATALPVHYLQSIKNIKNISEDELHDTFLKSWMILSSLRGFKTSPHVKKQTMVSFKSRISTINKQNILWAELKSGRGCVYAFQGNLIESATSSEFWKLIQSMNAGKVCQVSDYLRSSSKKKDLVSLQLLSEAGAFLVQ